MTQEDKELLLKDLCARLPYGVKVMKQFKSETRTLKSIDVINLRVYFLENDVNSPFGFDIEDPLRFSQRIKPYLRPMSSITEEEKKELREIAVALSYNKYDIMIGTQINSFRQLDGVLNLFNSHHLDWRGLIEKGLALEAPKGMYN